MCTNQCSSVYTICTHLSVYTNVYKSLQVCTQVCTVDLVGHSTWFRSFRSGFGSATILGCGFFSCISGSDAAGCASIGRMTIDRLVESGYPRSYAAALVAAGSCTGILIPPSIAYIVIGLILGVSTATLFVAAIIPGTMILLSIMATNVLLNRLHGYENSGIAFSFSNWIAIFKAVWPPIVDKIAEGLSLAIIFSNISTVIGSM